MHTKIDRYAVVGFAPILDVEPSTDGIPGQVTLGESQGFLSLVGTTTTMRLGMGKRAMLELAQALTQVASEMPESDAGFCGLVTRNNRSEWAPHRIGLTKEQHDQLQELDRQHHADYPDQV